MSARVRDFFYLDPVLVAQTLSQLDFGVFKQWEETLERASGKEGGASLSLWGAASMRARADRTLTEGSSVVFEQTAESYASRLLIRLEEEEQLVQLESDPAPELRRGTVLIAQGTVNEFKIAHFDSGGWSSQGVSKLYEINKEAIEFERPGGRFRDVKAIGVIEVASFTLIAPWIVENLRVPVQDILDEEVEMLAIARRTYREALGSRSLVVVRPIAIY